MRRVLIVDVELPILSGLSRALHDLCDFKGEVRTVVNGREAIYDISHCFYDICFLDIKLPDINGFDVMKGIKNISPETHVILMSASCLSNDFKKTIEKGEAFYIKKPFDFLQIKDTMKKALEENRNFTGTRNMVTMEGKKGKEFVKNDFEWTDIYGKKNF